MRNQKRRTAGAEVWSDVAFYPKAGQDSIIRVHLRSHPL
jgi:hypothetical protein